MPRNMQVARSGWQWRPPPAAGRFATIDIDKCAKCAAPMVLRALVAAAQTVTRFLRRLGEDAEPPPIAPSRRPPFFMSTALRRRFGELDSDSRRQMDMFDG